MEQANTCTRSRSFCFIYQNDKTKHERPRKTAPQGTKQGNARETPSQATNEPHGANNKPCDFMAVIVFLPKFWSLENKAIKLKHSTKLAKQDMEHIQLTQIIF